MASTTFRATIQQSGKTATGIKVPSTVVTALGAGKKPKVTVSLNGYTYRSSIAVMGGEYLVSLSAANREAAKVAAGDTVQVTLQLDTAPRTVKVPRDFAAALKAVPKAKATFDGLSNSNKSWHVLSIEGAKTKETRERRIAKSVATLKQGKPR